MEADAIAYNKLSGPQIEAGVQFIRELNLNAGDKVLDMGCGTGHLSKHIADIVGPDGLVVGVDPDAERIKIAKENYKAVGNLQFYVGDSVTGFPHDNEPYYDVHISTFVFHWVPESEKGIYIRKANQCLHHGGKLVIWCTANVPNDETIPTFHSYTKEGYDALLQQFGTFKDIVIDSMVQSFQFESLKAFKQWLMTSTHQGVDENTAFMKTFVATEGDGRTSFYVPMFVIRACKE